MVKADETALSYRVKLEPLGAIAVGVGVAEGAIVGVDAGVEEGLRVGVGVAVPGVPLVRIVNTAMP